jgi:hypothetical protein
VALQGRGLREVQAPGHRPKPSHLHLVFGESSGLVDAEHRRTAQRFDNSAAADENLVGGQPPGAQGQEHRQDHRKFFRDQRNGDGDPGQGPSHPIPAQQAKGDGHDGAENKCEAAQPSDQAAGRLLQRCRFLMDRGQGDADAAERGVRAGSQDLRHRLPANDQGA